MHELPRLVLQTIDNRQSPIDNPPVDLLGVRTVPFLARRNYVFELDHMVLWSVLAGLLEGQFAAVVVARTFHGSESQIAVATATPTAANLFSLVWGLLCVGRPKIRLATAFATGCILCAGAVAAIPPSPAGTYWFIAQVAAAQALLGGMVTVRSAIWRSNYPREIRGRITARLQSVRFVIGVATTLAAARLADHNPATYIVVYPVAAVCGAASLWMLTRIRIRGEGRELRRKRPPDGNAIAPPTAIGEEPDSVTFREDLEPRLLEPYSLTALLSPGHVLGKMYSVLRDDRRYLKYCVAQMFTGLANLMTISIVVAVITRDLAPGDAGGFWISLVLLDALPKLVMLGSLSRWGRIFDQLGVLGMRELNLLCWTASVTFGMLGDIVTLDPGRTGPGMFLLAVGFFVLRGLATGLGQGGGAVAWNIGHLHFARPEDAEVYMGIHVSLTGLRGLVAPVAGMWLWRLFGWPVWLLAIAFSIVSFYLYSSMAKDEQALR